MTIGSLPKRPVSRGFNMNRKTLDVIHVSTRRGSEEVVIPALPHSMYWTILRFLYQHPDQPIAVADLCESVRAFLIETDPVKWNWYVNRSTYRGRNGWRTRLIFNARNLCRITGKAAYGTRLTSIGHVLRFETGSDGAFFTLHTALTKNNTAPQKRGRRIGSGTRHFTLGGR